MGEIANPAADSMVGGATSTPASWRAAALGILFGGGIVGYRAASGRRGALSVAAGAALLGAAVVPVAIASRRPPIEPGTPGPQPADDDDGASEATTDPTFSIVVAARDEARVLPRLVADIAAQDWRDVAGRPAYELVVVDDRSVDGTAGAVLEAAEITGIREITRVIRRDGTDLPDGKGAALTAAQPDACRGEVVVVLDADARVGPSFLRTLAAYVRAGAPAITARRRIFVPAGSTLAAVQADEQTLDGELQRGRWALGGCSEFRGNGIVIRRDLLAALGGWRASALTEDLDLSSRLAAATGTTVAWAIDAEVWEEPVHSWRGLVRQRLRWAEGAVRRLLEHAPAMLRSGRLGLMQKADFGLYAGQLVAPPLVIGALVGAARRDRRAAAILLATYLAIGGGLGWDALRWETTAAGRPLSSEERLARAARLAAFNAVWLLAMPGALWRLGMRRGEVRYDKMPHHGSLWAGGSATTGSAPTSVGAAQSIPAPGLPAAERTGSPVAVARRP